MEQFKRAQVIMLPTNNKSHIYSNKSIKTLGYITGKIESDLEQFPNQTETQNQHLYIISDDEIKGEDWVLTTLLNKIERVLNNKTSLEYYKQRAKKIIATTDTSLFTLVDCPVRGSDSNVKYILSQPSQQFIKKYIESYNKGEVITDVLIEMEIDEEIAGYEHSYLKINSKDNTITIKKLKDSWNREEVKLLIEKYQDTFGTAQSTSTFVQDWIKNNLS